RAGHREAVAVDLDVLGLDETSSTGVVRVPDQRRVRRKDRAADEFVALDGERGAVAGLVEEEVVRARERREADAVGGELEAVCDERAAGAARVVPGDVDL